MFQLTACPSGAAAWVWMLDMHSSGGKIQKLVKMNAHVSAERENKQQVPNIHWKIMVGQCFEYRQSLLPPGGQKYVIAELKAEKKPTMSAVTILQ